MALRLSSIQQKNLLQTSLSVMLLAGGCAWFVPLPMAGLEKDGSTPYPCMDRPCGCRSAEDCWKSCCCFSNQEKVTWARQNNVSVPDYVVAAAELENRQSCDVTKSGCPHCASAKVVSPNDEVSVDAKQEPEPEEANATGSPRYLSGISAMTCRGLSLLWQVLSGSLFDAFLSDAVCGGTLECYLTVADLRPESLDRPVPDPPPRLADSV